MNTQRLLPTFEGDAPDVLQYFNPVSCDVQATSTFTSPHPGAVDEQLREGGPEGSCEVGSALGPVRAWTCQRPLRGKGGGVDTQVEKSLLTCIRHAEAFVAEPALSLHRREKFDAKESGEVVVAEASVSEILSFTRLAITDGRGRRTEMTQLLKCGSYGGICQSVEPLTTSSLALHKSGIHQYAEMFAGCRGVDPCRHRKFAGWPL
jgi:hypothetical protein